MVSRTRAIRTRREAAIRFDPFSVFLDLLEGHADGLGEVRLRHPAGFATAADVGAELDVDEIGFSHGRILGCVGATLNRERLSVERRRRGYPAA